MECHDVASSHREPKSDLALVRSGRVLLLSLLSFLSLINPLILPLRLELISSRWVRKSLFSIADVTMIGRGLRM